MKGIYLPGEIDKERVQLRLLQVAFWLGWSVVGGCLGFFLGAEWLL